MLASVAEDLDEQIGSTVDHPRLPRESGRTVHPSHELDDPTDAIERTNLGAERSERDQDRSPRRSAGFRLRQGYGETSPKRLRREGGHSFAPFMR